MSPVSYAGLSSAKEVLWKRPIDIQQEPRLVMIDSSGFSNKVELGEAKLHHIQQALTIIGKVLVCLV